jgi:hypothetical protein
VIDKAFVNRWAPSYADDFDTEVFSDVAPRVRRRGAYDRDDLLRVGTWKARGRTLGRLSTNSDEEIAYISSVAFAAPESIGYRMLTLLHGVGEPTASALLTVWDPDRFTVIDYRALESLRKAGELGAADPDYPAYLGLCRRIAERCGCELRTLDRALWQASKDESETTTS